jgi:hypothetical protein
MSRRKKKKGPHPLIVLGLSGAALAVGGRALLGGEAPLEVAPPADSGAVDPAAAILEGGNQAANQVVQWADLLALHGSFRPGRGVRVVFSAFENPASLATPGGETEAAFGRWIGEDPPLLKLGVVMISTASRRAVLGGRVVGVGDEFRALRVLQIEPGMVVVQWSGRRLTYDLDSDAPREFRSELAQRQSEGPQGNEAPENLPKADSPKEIPR